MKINEALNILQSTWDDDEKVVNDNILEDDATVANSLTRTAEHVKSDEFNPDDLQLTHYEKRLLAVGYMVGCEVTYRRILGDPKAMKLMIERYETLNA
jgi:hypothetical protein